MFVAMGFNAANASLLLVSSGALRADERLFHDFVAETARISVWWMLATQLGVTSGSGMCIRSVGIGTGARFEDEADCRSTRRDDSVAEFAAIHVSTVEVQFAG